MRKTTIDCVEMVRKIRDGLYLDTKDMTPEELIAFYSRPAKSAVSKPGLKRQGKAR